MTFATSRSRSNTLTPKVELSISPADRGVDLIQRDRLVAVGVAAQQAFFPVGGHFVTGHVDGMGVIELFERRGSDTYLRVCGPAGSGRHVIHKGGIAIDGISLTVAEVEGDRLAVWLIPTTLAVTNLGSRHAGERVNLEFDLLGKYVEKLVQHRAS